MSLLVELPATIHVIEALICLVAIGLLVLGLEYYRRGLTERAHGYVIASLILLAVSGIIVSSIHLVTGKRGITHIAAATVAPRECSYMFTHCTVATTIVTGGSGSNVTYSIDWGDNTTSSGVCHSRICIVTHSYKAGNYTVKVWLDGKLVKSVKVYIIHEKLKLGPLTNNWFLNLIISGVINAVLTVISWLASAFMIIARKLGLAGLVASVFQFLWQCPTPTQLPAMNTLYSMILCPYGIAALLVGALVNFLFNFRYFSNDPKRLVIKCLEDVAVGFIIGLAGPYIYLAFAYIFNSIITSILDPTAIAAITGTVIGLVITCLIAGLFFSFAGAVAGVLIGLPILTLFLLCGMATLRALLMASIYAVFPIIGAFWMISPLRRWISEPLIATLFGLMLVGVFEACIVELVGLQIYETYILHVAGNITTWLYTTVTLIVMLVSPIVIITLLSRAAIGPGLTVMFGEITGQVISTLSKVASRLGIDLSKARLGRIVEKVVSPGQGASRAVSSSIGARPEEKELIKDFIGEWTRQTTFTYRPTITRLESAFSKLGRKISRGIEKLDEKVWEKTRGLVSIRDVGGSITRGVDAVFKESTGIAPFRDILGVDANISEEDILREYKRYLILRLGRKRPETFTEYKRPEYRHLELVERYLKGSREDKRKRRRKGPGIAS
ncbi:MAG: hypothetical protein GXO10_06405 [Crenarchaeota archaeon]|nr:hypothetical protein [Thermoproteota archaeon]